MERCAIFETGTGFAGAKLSEILPSARVARFVRMTQKTPALAFVRMTSSDALLAWSGRQVVLPVQDAQAALAVQIYFEAFYSYSGLFEADY